MYEVRFGENVFSIAASTADRREAAELERQRRAASRKQSLAVLSSPDIEPRRRIALWEHLHGLYLPMDSKHALVNVIAKRTALHVEEVRHEQQRRSAEVVQEAQA